MTTETFIFLCLWISPIAIYGLRTAGVLGRKAAKLGFGLVCIGIVGTSVWLASLIYLQTDGVIYFAKGENEVLSLSSPIVWHLMAWGFGFPACAALLYFGTRSLWRASNLAGRPRVIEPFTAQDISHSLSLPQHSVITNFLWLALLPVLFGGLPLFYFFGRYFLPEYSPNYWVLVPLLALLSIVMMYVLERDEQEWSTKMPTTWIRGLAWPLLVMCMVGLMLLAGWGWIAGASRLLAEGEATVEIRVSSVSKTNSRSGVCYQSMRLIYKHTQQTMCADSLLPAGKKVPIGERMLATGIVSPLGIHVRELRAP